MTDEKNNAELGHDPSRTSQYVTNALYLELMANFSNWQNETDIISDIQIRDDAARLLFREARLLDRHLYQEWLTLFTPECIYWVPATPEAGDPRHEVAVMFDDRRRLEDRVYRLQTGYAWSQAPRSRTSRLITNIEVFRTASNKARMIRSNFLICEFWDDETRTLSGWTAHRIVDTADGWKIEAKQANLLECDQSIRNPSIIL